MEETPKKIDGRKNNPGRFGRKKPQPEITTSNQNTDQQTTSTMNETDNTLDNTTPVNNTSENTNTDNTQNTSGGGDEGGINVNKIDDAKIIDESKLSDTIEEADKSHTPLNEDVVHEDYRNQFAGTFKGRVQEPVFTKPDVNQIHQNLFGKKEETSGADTATNQTTGKEEKKVEGANPLSDNKLGNSLKNNFETEKERAQGAEVLVDGVLDAYAMLHQLGAKAASVNLENLQIEHLEGKIDLGIQIPVDPNDPTGDSVPLGVFLESYNTECKKAIVLDPDFVEKVRPVMIRVCEKNGWGLTDEQYLVYLFGRDLTEKLSLIISMKLGINKSLRFIKASHEALKQQNATANNNNNKSNNNNNNNNNNNSNDGPYVDPRQSRDARERDTRTTETTDSVMGNKKANEAIIVSETKQNDLSLTINKIDNIIE